MVAAARAAADPRVLEAVDSVRVVNMLSWRYRDPGLLLAQRSRAKDAATRYTGVGGNVPQSLVNQACLDIQAGRADVVLIAGAETWRTRTRLRASGAKPGLDESGRVGADGRGRPTRTCRWPGPPRSGSNWTGLPYVYPMFEQALRIAAGESAEDHLRRIGELWSQFSGVAARNPHAWSREPLAPPTRSGSPAAQPDDQLAVHQADELQQHGRPGRGLILDLGEKADASADPLGALGFPVRGHRCARHLCDQRAAGVLPFAGDQDRGQRALELAGVGVDDLELIDVYSCFPSAVQVAANELGLPVGDPSRPLTVTGGLTFAGGPWNNYVTHSIATMAERLVANPGQRGFITANGGYLTKHSFGVYGTEPPSHEFRWEDVQSEVDREPTRRPRSNGRRRHSGNVDHAVRPDGQPEKAFLAVRTPDDARALAVITDPAEAEATIRDDIAGAKVQVNADGTATLHLVAADQARSGVVLRREAVRGESEALAVDIALAGHPGFLDVATKSGRRQVLLNRVAVGRCRRARTPAVSNPTNCGSPSSPIRPRSRSSESRFDRAGPIPDFPAARRLTARRSCAAESRSVHLPLGCREVIAVDIPRRSRRSRTR